MTHSELKKQQKIQLKMLVDFDAFCKEHGLKYFMVYGTLLGAVRHKGFIPWDYDIDTAMTRAEYEKFKAIQHKLPLTCLYGKYVTAISIMRDLQD